jgi:tetratricopeptide (TPR) repeat protein
MRVFRSAALSILVVFGCSLSAAAQITISTDQTPGTLAARRGRYNVSGTVREGDVGRPIEAARVDLCTLTSGVVATAFTNSSGNFGFRDVPNGSYYLVVEAAGYQLLREDLTFTNRPLVGLQLGLRPVDDPRRMPAVDTVSTRALSIPRRAREAMERGLSLLHDKEDYRGSLSQFQRAIREYPQYYEAYAHMGVAYMRLEDLAQAEKMLLTSVDMSERQYAEGLALLAAVYSDQKRFAEAETVAREAVSVDSRSWLAHYELARALHELGQGAAAEASALEAARLDPANLQAILLLANIHLRMRNYVALLRDLDLYLELAPEGPSAPQARQMREQVLERMANIQPRPATAPTQ